MINAHCEQSSVVWAQDEKKLYNFRILELSEPFCEGKKCETVLSRSCDNVAQRMRQAERHKRISESSWRTLVRAPDHRPKMCSRTQSLPGDLSKCGRDFFSRQNSGDDHVFTCNKEKHSREGSMRKKLNGFNKGSIESDIHAKSITQVTKDNNNIEENSEEKNDLKIPGDRCRLKSEKTGAMTNHGISDVILDNECAQMHTNLRELSARFDENNLEEKSKPELISIILELQDALRLATDD